MDYEQKYKDALERAKKLKENPKAIFFEEKNIHVSDYIFPELKESEGERIRKILVGYFKSYKEQGTCGAETFNGIPTDNIIAWLEKQGEKTQGKTALEAINEVKVDNQNCVKPADKIEHKFKIGDSIIDEKGGTYEVIDVHSFYYTIKDCDNNEWALSFNEENKYKLKI